MSRIIAITNQKGGVGKTTTCVNLAASLSATRRAVLLVDLDPQGNATMGSGVDKRELELSGYNLLLDDTPIEQIIVHAEAAGYHLLPANSDLTAAEVQLIQVEDREARLHRRLAAVAERYDYILIDCPPSLGLLTLNMLTAADSVLIPIQCEYYALEGLSQLLNTIHLVQKNLNKNLDIEGVLLTMFDNRLNLSQQVAQEVREYFKDRVYKTIINRNVRLGEAPSFGKPIVMYDAVCVGSQNYISLAEEIINNEVQTVR